MAALDGPDFRVVSALCYSLTTQHFGPPSASGPLPHNDAAYFVIGQLNRMPDFLRPALRLLTFVFDWAAMLTHGRRFHRLTSQAREKIVARWRTSRIGPCRDLIRLYESLVLVHTYSSLTR
jgi:hypothetical protein